MTRYFNNPKQCRTFSVLSSISKIILPALFLITAIFVSSCEENPTSIGSDLLPGEDFVNIKSNDTIGIGIYNQYVDSVKTNSNTYSYLGNLYDPYFGTTTSDFVGQLRLTRKWPGGGPFTIDSIKLFFTITGVKGTLDSTIHRIKISEIGEMLSSSATYYSNRDPNAITDLGTFDLPVIAKDTVQNIEISIPPSFGEYLMRDTIKLTQEDEANDFRSFFRGIYVTFVDADPIKPFILGLTFSSGAFYIRVYYHNNNTSDLTYDFVINLNSVRYNRYSHNFATAKPETRIKHINDGVEDTLSFLQSFNGVFPKIKIPGLNSYKSMQRISVNKAKLTISAYLDNDIYTATTVPSQIYMGYIATDSIRYILPDYQISSSFFDGTFNSTKNIYTFNIASFVQLFLEGKIPKPEIEMFFPDGEYKNVILKSNNSSAPVEFEFTYTEF
jgi:hypothetical protein